MWNVSEHSRAHVVQGSANVLASADLIDSRDAFGAGSQG
jgi:hypothetical protein